MLPAFVKIVKPNVQKFNGNPLEYSKFKAAFNVEVDKKEVYDVTEKLKFLLDSVERSAKSCLAKFMPGSDKYGEQQRFGRRHSCVSCKEVHRSISDHSLVKENSVRLRQYQEIVSELTALEERFGRRHSCVSCKEVHRSISDHSLVKENSVRLRQYQEIVSELIGIFKEHSFVHELNSQVPEATVAKRPARLCGRWAEFVEGKPKLSTWSSFVN